MVLAALILPDCPAPDVFRRLRAASPEAAVILIAPADLESTALQAVKEGAYDYLLTHRSDAELIQRSIRYTLARRQAEDDLRDSEERYKLAADGANDGLWDWNLRTNRIRLSARWKEMIGYGDGELTANAQEWLDRIHPDDIEAVREAMAAHIDSRTTEFRAEYRLRHRDGSWRWMAGRGIVLRDAQGTACRMAGSQADITDSRRTAEQLVYTTFHDALTGLPNRAHVHERLTRAIRRSKSNGGYRFAILFLDLDRFKLINESLGHAAGDEVLVAFSRRLARTARPSDTIARLGGDEFVVFLDDICSVLDAQHAAEGIHAALLGPFTVSGQELYTTVSIGIAMSSASYDLPEQIIRDADTAMDRAKSLGRSRHEVFDKEMHDRAVAMLTLENDLRRALEKGQFAVQYQPIVNLESGRIRGFEALVRWLHPTAGCLGPTSFIPLAEETGLIVPMGWWVLREACRQLKAWQVQFPLESPLTMSVNLSSRQVMAPNLISELRAILEETRIDPGTLILEMTESVLMANSDESFAILELLRSLNVQLHIDDFGTGYSSLSYLQHIPTDTLKIDRSFISRIGDGDSNSEIVRTIVTLARNLGMRATVEGVETADQLERARSLECVDGQGFFFSEPRDSKEIELLLASSPRW